MTAITPENSARLTGLVTDRVANTNIRAYKVVVVEDDDAASGETYDLTNLDASITGIACIMCESWAGAVSTAASTWSSTTVTLPAHAGAYKAAFLCY